MLVVYGFSVYVISITTGLGDTAAGAAGVAGS